MHAVDGGRRVFPAGPEPDATLLVMPPVCRLAGCGEDAFFGQGFCFTHGIKYLRWRAVRDALERADLDSTQYRSYEDLDDDSPLADAVDLLHFFLTREPFA